MKKKQDENGKSVGAKTIACDCRHDMQDRMHGKGMRVHNPGAKQADGVRAWRCTVCGKEKS